MTDPTAPRKIISIDEIREEARQRSVTAGEDEAGSGPHGDDPDDSFPPPEPQSPGLWERIGDIHPGFTYLFLLLILVGFAIQVVTTAVAPARVFATGGSLVGPFVLSGATALAPWLAGDWWRLLSSLFLHANLLHIGANGIALVILGGVAERAYGHARFLVLLVVAGLTGSAASLWNQARLAEAFAQGVVAAPSAGSIGASGAIFGIGAAAVVALFRMRGLLPPWRVRALIGATLPLLLASLAGGFARPGTDNAAHLGGVVAGTVLGLALPFHGRLTGAPEPLPARTAWVVLGLLGLGILVASGVAAFVRAFA